MHEPTLDFDAPSTLPRYQGQVKAKSQRLSNRTIALIAIGSIGGAMLIVLGPFLCLWLYLAYSIMPRPWDAPNTPMPALHAAVLAGDVQAIDQCLQTGDPIDLQVYDNAQLYDGTTPLMVAASRGDAVMTKALIDRGANIHLNVARIGQAIHAATGKALEVLIDQGANVNARDGFGQTPLMRAAIRARTTKDLSDVRLLLDAGADVNARDSYGRTAIGVLQTWPDPDPEMIRLLEEAGGT